MFFYSVDCIQLWIHIGINSTENCHGDIYYTIILQLLKIIFRWLRLSSITCRPTFHEAVDMHSSINTHRYHFHWKLSWRHSFTIVYKLLIIFRWLRPYSITCRPTFHGAVTSNSSLTSSTAPSCFTVKTSPSFVSACRPTSTSHATLSTSLLQRGKTNILCF